MSKFYLTCCSLSLLMFFSINTIFAQQNVTGTVSSAEGALAGVTVSVVGTSRATQTEANGTYSIEATNGETLRFSIVGYLSKDVPVTSSVHNVTLEDDASEIGEVVVTAMGIRREERKLGYAVSTVKSAEILQASPTNFATALYGKAPGVAINTSAGGGNAAVSIDIRGNMNSISFQQQPLLVVDGVISRNGDVNNDGFWDDSRIRGNGILDINPENIESINILKGAAASALYGSDAAAGVIVVTTKSGRGADGFGVEFSATYGIEQAGVIPDYQFDFGPGQAPIRHQSNFDVNEQGFLERVVRDGRIWLGDPNNPSTFNIPAPSNLNNGDIILQPNFATALNFGPRFDGQDALYWDGQIRPYVGYSDNYRNFFQNGHSGIYNLAIFNATDKGHYRLSYTRNDYQSIMESGPQGKNTFNINSSYIITPKVTLDVVANYINERIENRPFMIDRMSNNFTGFLSPANDIRWFQERYRTSRGFRYVTFADRENDPDEAFVLPTAGLDYMNYFWDQRANLLTENNNRLMGAATVTYNILDNLSFRARMGTDFTSFASTDERANTVPLNIAPSGQYLTNSDRHTFTYGDLLLSYNTDITDNIGLSAQLGYQAREESSFWNSLETTGGLSAVNWFSMNADNQVPRGMSTRQTLVKDGMFGVLGLDINNYLFIEGSLRQERTSTLAPGNNVFYFPSVSAAFELTNAFNLPSFFNYSKLRASYGMVGNPPPPYITNVVYQANSASGVPTLNLPNVYGNNELRNELKHEMEFGWENQLLGNRLGFDITYYNNNIVDMILPLDVAFSSGTQQIMQNVGNMKNYGLELGLSGTPIQTSNFTWDSRINFSFNRNRLTALAEGVDRLDHSNIDGGSLFVRSFVGRPVGELYTYTLETRGGALLVDDQGFYVPDYDEMVHVGNIQPNTVGGFINNFRYKDFTLNTVIDFRYGGEVYSPSIRYGRAYGMYTETLFGRDELTGGLPYYRGADDELIGVPLGTTAGPNGQHIYHDGMILEGVTVDGQANTTIIEAGEYYLRSNNWQAAPGAVNRTGTYENTVFNNDFIRVRELALTYNLPSALAARLKANRLSIAAFGRNLFFLHKAIPHMDPEATVGTTRWAKANVGNAGIVPRSFGLTVRAAF